MDTWLVITIIAAIFVVVVWMYNRMVRQRNIVDEAWAGIDVQLQKRHELIPNLVITVRGYTDHESSLLEEITRQRGISNGTVSETGSAESGLSQSLGRLFALAEDYPDLKANEGFMQLHESLVEIEDHIQYARRYYNGAVRDNNNLVQSFPANLLASVFGFKQGEFFEVDLVSTRQAPTVSLDRT